MTHTTGTGRAQAPRMRSHERACAAWPMGIPSASTGIAVPRAFALRTGHAATGSKEVAGRADRRGGDS
jgi:hypothetical protein